MISSLERSVAVVMFLIMISVGVLTLVVPDMEVEAETGGPVENPLTNVWLTIGNWTIQNGDSITHSSKTIRLNGNLVVENGGKLTLNSVKLEVNSLSHATPFGIYVRSGGTLILNNCNVTEYFATGTPMVAHYFKFEVYGKLTADNTDFSYLWGDTTGPIWNPLEPSGIQVFGTNQVSISNCSFVFCEVAQVFLNNSDAVLKDNHFQSGFMGILATDSAPIVDDNSFDRGSYAIYMVRPEDGTSIINNYFHRVYQTAITATSGTLSIEDNAFRDVGNCIYTDLSTVSIENNSMIGSIGRWSNVVYIFSSDLTFKNNVIRYINATQQGDWIYPFISYDCQDLAVINNTISDCEGLGMYIGSTDSALIKENTIEDTYYGTYMFDADNAKLVMNTFKDNDIGLNISECSGVMLENNTLSNDGYDIILNMSGLVRSMNTSFDPDSVMIDTYDSQLRVEWFVDLKVKSPTGTAINGANVKLFAKDSTQVMSGTTNTMGRIDDFWAPDYVLGRNSTYTFNPYHVEVSNWGQYDNSTIFITQSQLYEVVFAPNQPTPPGDWIVNTSEYLTKNNTHLDENFVKPDGGNWLGNLTIRNGGTLILENVSLELQSTSAKKFKITVENGGYLVMRNSSIFNRFNSTSSPYVFEIYGKAMLYNTVINYSDAGVEIYNDNVSLDECWIPVSANGDGVYCYYSAPSVTNSTITTSNYAVHANSFASPYLYNNDLKTASVGVYMKTQCFGTVLFNEIYQNAGNGIHLISSSPFVKNNYVYQNGGNGIYVDSSSSTIFGNDIYDNDFHGIYFAGSSNAKVQINDVYNNDQDGIVFAGSSSDTTFPVVSGNFIHNNRYGVAINKADPTLEHNMIHNNTLRGVTVSNSAEPLIGAGNMIKNNPYGIYFDNAAGMVNGTNVSLSAIDGIYTSTATPIIINTELYGNYGRGIYVFSNSDVWIEGCLFEGNNRGIETFTTNPRVEDCTFNDNNHSIYMTSSSPVIANSTFSSSNTKHFYLSVSNPRSIDNTIPAVTDIYLSEPTSKFFYAWWVDVKVIDPSFNPVSGASLKVYDKGSNMVINKTTDDQGYVMGRIVDQYSIQDNNNDKDGADWGLIIPEKTDLTPHNFTASADGYGDSFKVVTVNTNYLKSGGTHIVITMQGTRGPNAPANVTPSQSHHLQPNITWSPCVDPDGTAVQYHITITNETGGVLVNDHITTNNYYNITFDLEYGSGYHPYDVDIYAEDADNETSVVTEHVLVIINTPPELEGIGPVYLDEGDTLNLQLNGTDTDTNPVDVLTYGTNGTMLTLNTSSGAVSWVTADGDVGVYVVNFTVTDNIGGWDYTVVTITVNDTGGVPPTNNTPPVAVCGANQTVTVNDTVTLNGTDSYDPDGDGLTYDWNCTNNATYNVSVTFTNENSASPTFTPTKPGTYNITLQVTDTNSTGTKTSELDYVWIEVIQNRAPTAVIVSPDDQATFNNTDHIIFNANQSSDPDNNTLEYTWYSNRTGTNETYAEIGTGIELNTSLPVGIHTITLNVSDNNGMNSNASATIELTILQGVANDPPVVNLSYPQPGRRFLKDQLVGFDASTSSDPDGDTLKFTWESNISGVFNTGVGTSYEAFSTNLEEGHHKITLYVDDGMGHNVSANVNIEVYNRAPVAEAGDYDPVNKGETISFYAGMSSDADPSDTNLTYQWDLDDDGTIEGNGIYFNRTFADAGRYSIRLYVNDGSKSNHTSSDVAEFRINTPPVAVCPEDITDQMNQLVTFDAANCTDEDEGDEVNFTFRWDFGDGTNQVTPSLTITHVYTEAGVFNVTLNLSDGFAWDTDEMQVTIEGTNLPPIPDFIFSPDRPSVDEDGEVEVTFDASASYDPEDDINDNGVIDGNETDTLEYRWDFGDDSEDTGISPSHDFEAGSYEITLYVTDVKGTERNVSQTLKVNVRPTAAFTQTKAETMVGWSVGFDASTSADPDDASGSLTYDWEFGDSSTASGKTPSHKWTTTGSKTITLTVTDDDDGTADTTGSVTVYKLPAPSVNTPGPATSHEGSVNISGSTSNFNSMDADYSGVQISLNNGVSYTIEAKPVNPGDWSQWYFHYTPDVNINITIVAKAYANNPDSSSEKSFSAASDPIAASVTAGPDGGGSADTGDLSSVLGIVFVVILLVILVIAGLGGAAYYFIIRPARAEGDVMVSTEEDDTPVVAVAGGTAAAQQRLQQQKLAQQKAAQAKAAAAKPAAASKPAAAAKPAAKKRPIRCPKCKEIFKVTDDGTRPLKTRCPYCNAKGMIKGEEKKEEEPKKEATLKCPKCSHFFKVTGDEDYFECPKCGTEGELSDAVKKKLGLDKKVEEEVVEKEMEMLRCPVCSETFDIEVGQKEIECPHCGVKGSL